MQAKTSLATLVQDLNKTQMKADAPKGQVGDSVRIGLAVQVNSNHHPLLRQPNTAKHFVILPLQLT